MPFYSNSPKRIVIHTWLEWRPQLPYEVGIGKAFTHLWEIFFPLQLQCWCFSPLIEHLLMVPAQVYERHLPMYTVVWLNDILLNTLNLDNTSNESMCFCFLPKYSWFLLSILDLMDHSCYFSLCFYLDLSETTVLWLEWYYRVWCNHRLLFW